MTSSRKAEANRRNAQRSTGPRTVVGKARARQNATKHSLSVPACLHPEFAEEVKELEDAIRNELRVPPEHIGDVRRAAQAEIDVRRARALKVELTNDLLLNRPDASGARSPRILEAAIANLVRADRYERRALSQRKFAVRQLILLVRALKPNDSSGK